MEPIRKYSVIIAAYNEENTLEELIRRVKTVQMPGLLQEIVVVDDGSQDRTKEILRTIPGIVALFHEKNRGKGGALKTGIAHATGDILILQDADLEYTPEDYPTLMAPILGGRTELVLGSRFFYRGPRFLTKNGDPFLSHYIGNKLIIAITNFLYGQKISDYEGCYKAFTRSLAQKIKITTDGFDFDNELICKSLRKGYRITEVPIRYQPRLYSEGKKIRWKDGIYMLWTILKWRFFPIPE